MNPPPVNDAERRPDQLAAEAEARWPGLGPHVLFDARTAHLYEAPPREPRR